MILSGWFLRRNVVMRYLSSLTLATLGRLCALLVVAGVGFAWMVTPLTEIFHCRYACSSEIYQGFGTPQPLPTASVSLAGGTPAPFAAYALLVTALGVLVAVGAATAASGPPRRVPLLLWCSSGLLVFTFVLVRLAPSSYLSGTCGTFTGCFTTVDGTTWIAWPLLPGLGFAVLAVVCSAQHFIVRSSP
jgi:hypothetical protein